MDNYRDLVGAALALAFAGFMLVAGYLYLEQRAQVSERPRQLQMPDQKDSSAPVASVNQD